MDDESKFPTRWTERKLYEAVDDQMHRPLAAPTPNQQLGHISSARALLGVLADRLTQHLASGTKPHR